MIDYKLYHLIILLDNIHLLSTKEFQLCSYILYKYKHLIILNNVINKNNRNIQ